MFPFRSGVPLALSQVRVYRLLDKVSSRGRIEDIEDIEGIEQMAGKGKNVVIEELDGGLHEVLSDFYP